MRWVDKGGDRELIMQIALKCTIQSRTVGHFSAICMMYTFSQVGPIVWVTHAGLWCLSKLLEVFRMPLHGFLASGESELKDDDIVRLLDSIATLLYYALAS